MCVLLGKWLLYVLCVVDDREHRELGGHEGTLCQGVGVHAGTQDGDKEPIQELPAYLRGHQGTQCVQGEDQADGGR